MQACLNGKKCHYDIVNYKSYCIWSVSGIYIYILIIVTQIGKVFVTFILCLNKISKNLWRVIDQGNRKSMILETFIQSLFYI